MVDIASCELALAEYESVLKLAPNRFNALYGAASAAEAKGDAAAAADYFRKLAIVGAGGERPELQELIAAVAREPTRPIEGRLSRVW